MSVPTQQKPWPITFKGYKVQRTFVVAFEYGSMSEENSVLHNPNLEYHTRASYTGFRVFTVLWLCWDTQSSRRTSLQTGVSPYFPLPATWDRDVTSCMDFSGHCYLSRKYRIRRYALIERNEKYSISLHSCRQRWNDRVDRMTWERLTWIARIYKPLDTKSVDRLRDRWVGHF